MMNDLQSKARGKSLTDLMAAMDQDQASRIPALRDKLAAGQADQPDPEEAGETPVLTLRISLGSAEPDDAPDQTEGDPSGEPDPFQEMLRRKRAEKANV